MKVERFIMVIPFGFFVITIYLITVANYWAAAFFGYMTAFLWCTILAIQHRKKRQQREERMINDWKNDNTWRT